MRRWRWFVAAVCGVLLAGGAAFVVADEPTSDAAPTSTVARATTTTAPRTTTTPAPVATPFDVAHAAGPSVALYDAPGAAASFKTLSNPTWEGLPLAFAVRERRPDGWLRVAVPMRPNGTEAWIQLAEVTIAQVPNRIVVDVTNKQLVVLEGGTDRELFRAPVAVGTARTPTPRGEFYVDGEVDLRGGGAYGSRILSVAGFSEVHMTFGGGVGQIAIHGTNRPALIGQEVSNGCIRMNDADVDVLSTLAPVGTPVSVV
jgi:lipoprotein-anchoring transpeptidase ErfK/SrfK